MGRAVIFDVGGVLLVPDVQIVARAFRSAGLEVDETRLAAAHYRALHHFDDETQAFEDQPYVAGYLEWLGFTGEQCTAGRRVFEEDLWKIPAIDLWSQPVPGGAELLTALCSERVPVAIVSNSDGTVEESLRSKGLCQVGEGPYPSVAVIVDSAVVGVMKPDPRIFLPAIAALDVDPGDVLYIGDSERIDVRGAEAAGIRPVHLDPYGLCRNPDAHAHLTSHIDIWKLLK